MPKMTVLGRTQKQKKVTKVAFTDPATGEESVVYLRSLNMAEMLAVKEWATDDAVEWVTGRDGETPNQYAPEGRPIAMSETLWQAARCIEAMQCDEQGGKLAPADAYDVRELIIMSADDELSPIFSRLADKAGELASRSGDHAKNSGRASMATTSAPSPATTTSTPG